jgi:hypothetical protein
MFTKEHYESVARILSAARGGPLFVDSPEAANINQRLDALAEDFADYFEQDNELFARKAFIGACRAASRSEIRRLVSANNTLGQYQKGQRAKAAARRRDEKW